MHGAPSDAVSGRRRPLEGAQPTTVGYYTVSNHTYFLGTVALLNSLRVTGNEGALYVLDAGLAPAERAALDGPATVVSLPETRGNPALFSPYPHLLGPSGVVVVIDSDIIVTASLDPITALAREGQICVCPAWTEDARKRWFAEWEQQLQLRAPLRRGEEWVHVGFVAFDTGHWPGFLERWWDVSGLVPSEDIFKDGRVAFSAGDADALNSLLMSEIPRAGVAILSPDDEVYVGNAKVDDPRTLASSVDGRPARFLHVPDRPKPWERRGWLRRGGVTYLRLMRRLIFGTDAALSLKADDVPIWLRPGAVGKVALSTAGVLSGALNFVAQRVPERLGERLRRLRRRAA
jgi:hypothetical protein